MSDNKVYTEDDINYQRVEWVDNVTPLNAKNLNSMEDGIVTSMVQLRYVDDRVAQNKTDIGLLDGRVNTLENTTIPAIKGRVETLEGKVGTLEGKVGTLEDTTIPAIQTTVNNITTAMDKARATAASFNSETGTLVLEVVTFSS